MVFVLFIRIGVSEPPTIAEMEKEFETLPNEINPDEDSVVDLYVDKTPEQKSSWNKSFIIGIFIAIVIIIIIIGLIIYFVVVDLRTVKQNEKIIHVDSDTSIASKYFIKISCNFSMFY